MTETKSGTVVIPLQMGVSLSAVIIDLISFIEFAGFEQQVEWRGGCCRLLHGFPKGRRIEFAAVNGDHFHVRRYACLGCGSVHGNVFQGAVFLHFQADGKAKVDFLSPQLEILE